MDFYTMNTDADPVIYDHVYCEECENTYPLPRNSDAQERYVKRKLESRDLKNAQVFDIDGESIPVAETKIKTKDGKYFVTALLTKSKVGLRLVVYAGEKGSGKKTQIFVEPDIKRLAFDQRDLHPSDVFSKVEAEFADGTKQSIEKKKNKK